MVEHRVPSSCESVFQFFRAAVACVGCCQSCCVRCCSCAWRRYSDLLRNPLVVPLTILRGKTTAVGAVAAGGAASGDGGGGGGGGAVLGVLDCAFHPTQPWVFGASADHNIRLFQNIH